jgi:hypothetical protein
LTDDSLELDLLGTRFSIEMPGGRWSAFLRELWHEFEAPPASAPREVRVQEEDGRAMLTLPDHPALPFDDPWQLVEVLRYSIVEQAVERAEALIAFHAAALTKGGAGILCAGPSGAGKTTLAIALAHAGWALAGDDIAPIDAETGLVRPFPKPLSIRRPELWPGPSPWAGRWPPPRGGPMLVPADHFARQREPFRPGNLLFIEYAPDEAPEDAPIPPGRAAATSIEYVRPGGPAAVTTLARLCRAAPAARLRYRNSDEAVEMIEELMANRQK